MALTLSNNLVKVTATVEGSAETVHTASVNNTKVVGIRAANIDGVNSADINLFIANGGTNYYICKDVPVPAGGSIELGSGEFAIKSGDVVKVFASAASDIDLILSYAEIS